MSTPTAAAEAALERGDYGQCLQLLEPLAEAHPITDAEGARIRMIMVTAWMGQGQDDKALSTCRLLTRCRDSDLRLRAKQLLEVLEAPSLQRPASWSMQLPPIDVAMQVGNRPKPVRRRRSQGPPPPPPPPTGPTQAAAPGFAVVVVAVLVGLTLLLSGCGTLSAEIDLVGPDRIQLGWSSDSGTGQLLPWQSRFSRDLQTSSNPLQPSHHVVLPGAQQFEAPVLPAAEAEQLLRETIATAARSTGLNLAEPTLRLQERNWLVGVQQSLDLELDLAPLADLPMPDLKVNIRPAVASRQWSSEPLMATAEQSQLVWPLQTGERNHFRLRRWHWSRLGLGAVVVALLLALSLVLQQLRLKLGFGFPELPSSSEL